MVLGAFTIGISIAGWLYFRDQATSISLNNSANDKTRDKNILAAVCRDSACYWLNKLGVAFSQSGKLSGNIVLNIEDKTSRELKIGSELVAPATLAELLFLRNRITEDIGISLVSGETQDSNLADFDFAAAEGWKLRLSTSENAYKTLETLKQTLAEVSKTAPISMLDYVDLRIPNKVYYKFK